MEKKREITLFFSYLLVGCMFSVLITFGDELFSTSVSYNSFLERINNTQVSYVDISDYSNKIIFKEVESDASFVCETENLAETKDLISEYNFKNPLFIFKISNRGKNRLINLIINLIYFMICIYLFRGIINSIIRLYRVYQFRKLTNNSKSSKNKENEPEEDEEDDDDEDNDIKFRSIFSSGSFKPRIIKEEKTKFSDVIGLNNQLEELRDIVSFLSEPNKYNEIGATIPKGVLLFGRPGTGKTLIARAIAGEADVPFIQLSASEIQAGIVGESEKNIRKLFEKAKRLAPSIIFLDEIDSIAQQRYSDYSSKYSASMLNQFLACMDGFEPSSGVIVIAATNYKEILDQAILRRFERQIYIKEPDKAGREEIIRYYMQDKKFDEDFLIDKLAMITTGFTGADIKTLLNESAILAVRRGSDTISNDDIYEAYRKKTIGIQDNSPEKNLKERRISSIHEAGHAVVSRVLGKTPMEISIIPRGNAGGYNLFNIDDMSLYSVKDILDRVKVSLGGRAAEKVIIGEFYSGASADLRNATEMLKNMHLYYGMGSNIEVQLVYANDNEFNRNILQRNMDIQQTELLNCYNETINIINNYKFVVERLAEIIYDKELMENKEIEAFFASFNI